MSDRAAEQRRLILEQFTKQAVPFAAMPAHSNDEANRLLIDLAGIGPADRVLDVACGPGLVACRLALLHARQVQQPANPASSRAAAFSSHAGGLRPEKKLMETAPTRNEL
jgi:hypothetical protein